MKRTVITVGGNGMLSIPSNLQDLWMSSFPNAFSSLNLEIVVHLKIFPS